MKNMRAQEDQARATKYPSLPNNKPHNTVKIILGKKAKKNMNIADTDQTIFSSQSSFPNLLFCSCLFIYNTKCCE